MQPVPRAFNCVVEVPNHSALLRRTSLVTWRATSLTLQRRIAISFHPESSFHPSFFVICYLSPLSPFLWSHLIWMIYLHCKHLSSINRWSATRVLVLQRRWRTWNLGCCQTAISYSRAKTLGGIWFLVSLVINIIVAFIAKIVCAHSANALGQMAIQLPKLRVAVRPHHVQIPVSRSLAVTMSHPPKVGRRSQNAMIFVFSIYAKIERNLRSPASLSFSGSQRLLLPLFRMRRQFRCRMGMVPQRILKYLKKCLEISGSRSFRIF